MRAAEEFKPGPAVQQRDWTSFRELLHRRGLVPRILFLALLFSAELLVISVALDGSSLATAVGLAAILRDWGPWVLRAIVGAAVLFATFAWLTHRATLDRISLELEELPIGWWRLLFHFVAMAAFAAVSWKLYRLGGAPLSGGSAGGPTNLLAAEWLAAGVGGILLAALAILPSTYWSRLIASDGRLWSYVLVVVLLACVAGNYSRSLWRPASWLTFHLVQLLLKPIFDGLIVNPALLAIGTARFRVIISPECSGIEGAGLILAFGIVWLLLFRRECRFPQSLVLIPAGVVVLFLLNATRIAALVLIGDAGARQIAAGGFHSQAGWILFNAVAAGFCVTIRNVPWFTSGSPASASRAVASAGLAGRGVPSENATLESAKADNPTAAYLVPFLAILAAGMLATAASGGFEWLYPLRIIAAAAALWFYRRHYAGLNWAVSWFGVVAGVLAFAAWIALDRAGGQSSEHGIPAALLAASPWARSAWMALRAVAAVTTVPLAEELAFRGFLMRRLIAPDFEMVSAPRVTWFAVATSAVVFGLLHGSQWIAGAITGVVFGLVWKRRGSMGDAVAAHVTANALLAAYVLTYGQWHLW